VSIFADNRNHAPAMSDARKALPTHVLAVRKVVRTLPGLIFTGLVAAILLATIALGRGRPWLSPAMLAGVGPALAALLVYTGLRTRTAVAGSARLMAAFALVLGALQGTAFGDIFLIGGDRWLLGVIVAAAAIGSLIALSALPVAGGLFILSFACAGLVAAGGPGYLPAAVMVFAVLVPVAIVAMRAEQAELRRSARAEQGGSRASALVAMFEESGKYWFWETDAHGNLIFASPTLAVTMCRTPGELIGRPLNALFLAAGDADAIAPPFERTIDFRMAAGIAFSDLTVRANVPGAARWWTLTGRPLLDPDGRLHGYRGIGADISDQRRSETDEDRLARFDPLTGLPNRAFMLHMLERTLRNAWANPVPCALMLLDLDRLDRIAETHGGPVGAAVARLVAERLDAVVGQKGRAARLGDRAFGIVLPAAPAQADLARLASDIIWKLSQPYRIGGSDIVIGASVGIAVTPADGDSADLLLRNAGLALQAALDAGKGGHRFYVAQMEVEPDRGDMRASGLRHILAENGLHLVYQPVVCANAETIVAFEALARWIHPEHGAIMPADFMPVTETIAEAVLRLACIEAASWPPHVRVAVTVSPAQLADPAFPAIVTAALADSGLAPARLELEVIESMLLDDGGDTDAIFARLKTVGVRLALGGFGTGYSAMGYLRDAPFDKIKIDRSLLQDAAVPGNRSAAIITAIVSLADAMGMDSAAEGVETSDERALIRALGFSQIQGDIFGFAVPAIEAGAKIGAAPRPAAAEGVQRLRAPRIAMLRPATLHHDGDAIAVRIRNISASGAQIEIDADVADGSAVTLDLGGEMAIPAIARWSQDGRMGMAFTQMIELDRVAAIWPPQRAVA